MADRRPSDSNIDWLPWYEQLKMHRRLQSKHSKPDPKKRASTLKSLLEFAPVTGEAASAIHAMDANKRAADDLQSGDYWGALSNYGDMALGLLGAVPLLGMAGRAGNKMAKGIKAYHGSPHDFDKFDRAKLGEDEPGFFFTTDPDVAEGYAYKDGKRGKVYEVEIDPKFYEEHDWQGQRWEPEVHDMLWDEFDSYSGDYGTQGVVVKNISDTAGGSHLVKPKVADNYVAFNPDAVKIVRKYGIPAAIAMGLISASDAEALQSQGFE